MQHGQEATDTQLVIAAQAGDKAAFGTLIERYLPMVQRLALRSTRHADLARDLAQEALLQAYLSLDTLRAPDRFRAWLYGLTLNVCRTFWRTQRSEALSLDALYGGVYREPADHGPTPEAIVERLALREAIMGAVEGLSAANRAAVMLCYYEGFRLAEAAELLGITVTALKGRLHKAKRQLQVTLLPIYHSMLEMTQEERLMIPVHIVDVRFEKVETPPMGVLVHCQVILHDPNGNRAIVIWIGEPEGTQIALTLNSGTTPRPMTAVFMARLLNAANATLESVEISNLKEMVFFATAKLRVGGAVHEVDARPSDALLLALQTQAPIFVSAAVMDATGVALPANAKPNRAGLSEWQTRWQELQQHNAALTAEVAAKPSEQLQAEHEERAQQIVSALFA